MAEVAPLLPQFSSSASNDSIEYDESRSWRKTIACRIGGCVLAVGAVAALGVANTRTAHTTSVLAAQDPHIDIIPTNVDYSALHSLKTTSSYPWLTRNRLVEPYRETNIEVNLYSAPAEANAVKCDFEVSLASSEGVYGNIKRESLVRDRGTLDLSTDDAASWRGSFSHPFEAPGQYSVSLSCSVERHDTVVEFQDTLDCFYVRRELRELSTKMRDDFLDAFQVMASTPTAEGVKIYDVNYRSLEDMEIIHVAGSSLKRVDHLHDGLGLITQHAAMTADFELALQSVNPAVAVPYWDFTIDSYEAHLDAKAKGLPAADYGEIFKNGLLFSGDWFGKTNFESHRVVGGRFADQTVPRSYEYEIRSPYGFLRAPWNLNPSKYVTRYHKFCGEKISAQFFVNTTYDADDVKNHLAWPTCDTHFSYTNTDTYDSWYEFAAKIGYQPHAPVHAWIGGIGGGSCEDGTWDELYHAGKITHQQLMTIKHKAFYFLRKAYKDNVIQVPKHCSADTPVSECKWICEENFWDTEDGEDYAVTYFDIKKSHPYYKEVVTKITCETPFWPGDHLEAASPVEASFWPVHPTLERLMQYKQLVRPFTDKSWNGNGKKTCLSTRDTECRGHNAYDATTFATTVMNKGNSKFERRHLTNQQMRESTNPTKWALEETSESEDFATIQPGYAMPYVYNHFEWDHCANLGVNFKKVSFDFKH